MRSDMAKVITDEPRHGPRYKDRKGTHRDWDRIPEEDKPYKERGNLRFKWMTNWADNKEFGEHLGPLKRFAISCVGKKWDDVYSEVCKYIDKGNVTQNHILTHLYQYIAVKCKLVNNIVCYNEAPYHPVSARYGAVVYVDPETNIVKRIPDKPKRRRNKKTVNVIKLSDDRYHIKDKTGIWYECWMKPCPEPYIEYREYGWASSVRKFKTKIYPKVYDVIKKCLVDGQSKHTNGKYCYKKLQLNKREIRRLLKKHY